jgi:hypothetical protein
LDEGAIGKRCIGKSAHTAHAHHHSHHHSAHLFHGSFSFPQGLILFELYHPFFPLSIAELQKMTGKSGAKSVFPTEFASSILPQGVVLAVRPKERGAVPKAAQRSAFGLQQSFMQIKRPGAGIGSGP